MGKSYYMHQFYKRFFCSLIVFVGIGLLVLKGYCFFYPVRQTESGKAVSESVPVGTKMESRLKELDELLYQPENASNMEYVTEYTSTKKTLDKEVENWEKLSEELDALANG